MKSIHTGPSCIISNSVTPFLLLYVGTDEMYTYLTAYGSETWE